MEQQKLAAAQASASKPGQEARTSQAPESAFAKQGTISESASKPSAEVGKQKSLQTQPTNAQPTKPMEKV